MNIRDLVIKALKIEAKNKPDERLIIGNIVITYKDISEMIDHIEELDAFTKMIINNIINNAILMFKSSEEFRNKVLSMAGE